MKRKGEDLEEETLLDVGEDSSAGRAPRRGGRYAPRVRRLLEPGHKALRGLGVPAPRTAPGLDEPASRRGRTAQGGHGRCLARAPVVTRPRQAGTADGGRSSRRVPAVPDPAGVDATPETGTRSRALGLGDGVVW